MCLGRDGISTGMDAQTGSVVSGLTLANSFDQAILVLEARKGILQLSHVVVQHFLVGHVAFALALAFTLALPFLLCFWLWLLVLLQLSVMFVVLVMFCIALLVFDLGVYTRILSVGIIFVDIEVLCLAVTKCGGHCSTRGLSKAGLRQTKRKARFGEDEIETRADIDNSPLYRGQGTKARLAVLLRRLVLGRVRGLDAFEMTAGTR